MMGTLSACGDSVLLMAENKGYITYILDVLGIVGFTKAGKLLRKISKRS